MTAVEYIRPAAAAKRFTVSARTLSRWADAGLIGRSRVGRTVWLNASDIADLIGRHTTQRSVVPMPAVQAIGVGDWLDDPFWKGAVR